VTENEIRQEIDACGPDITDQQRLRISIKHWLLKERWDDKTGDLIKGNEIGRACCALCDKYQYHAELCKDAKGNICVLGLKGCFPIYNKAHSVLLSSYKSAFLAAADEMIAFLESFLEVKGTEKLQYYAGKSYVGIAGAEGILKPYSDSPAHKRLMDKTLFRFNAYGEMVAKLKERKAAMEKGRDYGESLLISKLLAIAEPPKEKPLAVGDEIEAGKVPVGAKVRAETLNGFIGLIAPSKSDYVRIKCSCCNESKQVARASKCTILELPEKSDGEE
jgi:hypothetical protein